MEDSDEFYTRNNLASWDEAAPYHAAVNPQLEQAVQQLDYNNLNDDFNALVDSYSPAGKSVVQICCNNGRDLLSVKNKGAGFCLGIDGAPSFIAQAEKLAALAGHHDVEYIHSNIYELPEKWLHQFDVAMITVGVINWMPDLDEFIRICASLIKPGGVLLMEEIHPVLNMYEEGEPSYLQASYFNREPYRDNSGLDYFTGQKYQAKENYWFQHTLSDLFTAAIKHGLVLEHFKELPYNIGNVCADLEHAQANPPLGMDLAWRKA